MAMVIDDRSKVWEDKDQPRVHVVPPFTPYYAPQAESTTQAAFSNSISPTIPRFTWASQKGLLGAPIRRDGGVLESDSDARTRPLTKNGQDIRNASSGDPPILSRVPGNSSWSSVQSQGCWLVEEEVIGKGQLNNRAVAISSEGDSLKFDKPQPHQNALNSTCYASTSGFTSQVSQAHPVNEWQRQNFLPKIQSFVVADGAASQSQASFSTRELQGEVGKVNGSTSSLSIGVLQEIGRRCCTKVEFRSVVSTSEDLQFSVEVLFTGEKIGAGMGKTRRDAHQQAAENALRSLADKYIEYFTPRSGTMSRDLDKFSLQKDNGFLCDVINAGSIEISTDEELHMESSSKALGVSP